MAVIGAAGGAIDFGNNIFTQTKIQGALDAAVVAGVSSSILEEYQIKTAEKYYQANSSGFAIEGQQVAFKVKQNKLIGEVSGTINSSLMKAVGYESTRMKVTSVGEAGTSREPACVLAMHPTRKHTLEMKGSVSFIAPQCHIYGNSNHFNDVVDPHTPQNFMTGLSVAAVGGGHHYIENVTPEVEFGHEIIANPLNVTIPSSAVCIGTKFKLDGAVTVLQPGKYCGGLNITNGSQVKLVDGGQYIISDGTFKIQDSVVTGKNAVIFLEGDANVELNEATLVLEAPKSGKYAGLAVVGDPVSTSNSFVDSTIDIHGVFYMPSGDFQWTNKGTPVLSAKWSTFIVEGFSWGGTGTINLSFDIEGSDVPFPNELRVIPRPANARLIH